MTKDPESPRSAVALKYDGVSAPRITAKGFDELAQQIVELARAHNVPLHEDPQLAMLLSQLELGDEIPESLYFVIAHVITFAYMVSGKMPPRTAAGRDED